MIDAVFGASKPGCALEFRGVEWACFAERLWEYLVSVLLGISPLATPPWQSKAVPENRSPKSLWPTYCPVQQVVFEIQLLANLCHRWLKSVKTELRRLVG